MCCSWLVDTLATTSDVFDAMFHGEMNMEDEVEIPDATASAFKEFLQFFYERQIELTEENVSEVMYLGHKYLVPECIEACVKFLKETLTNENMCKGLALALPYDEPDLLRFCKRRIAMDAETIFKTESFLNCDQKVLRHILKMGSLSSAETEVFKACVSWVKAQSGQDVVTREAVQTHLGDLFHEIRFASMTGQEFATLYSSFETVFLRAEYIVINQMIVVAAEVPTESNINPVPRQVEWNSDAVIKCDLAHVPNAIGLPIQMRRVEVNRFSSSEPVLLGSFVCTKVYNKQNLLQTIEMPVRIQIVESFAQERVGPNLENVLLFELETNLKSDSQTVVSLLKPLVIRPHYSYKIMFPTETVQTDDSTLEYNCPQLKRNLHVDSDIVRPPVCP